MTSKIRDKFKQAIKAKGYEIEKIEYNGTGWDDGGWVIWLVDYHDVITGFNYKKVLEYIDKYLPSRAQNSK